MPRTALSWQEVVIAGLTPTFGAVDQPNGNTFPNDGNVYIEVKNASGVPITVTLSVPAKGPGGLSYTNPTVSVPATTGDKIIGPFDPTAYNQAGGVVNVDFSAGTSVTIAVIHLPN